MSWPQVRISEVSDIVSGATPKTGVSNYWGGDIAWATPADLSDLVGTHIDDTPRKITEAGLRSCAASILPANSVLFSSRAPIGHVAINTVPMATNQGFKSFVPDAASLDAKFLFWWLKAHRQQLEAMGTGATFKEVSKATVSRVKIPLAPLSEQKRIAAILDKADKLCQKRRRAIALLDSLTQSIFLEMFGEDDPRAHDASLADLADVQIGYPFKSENYTDSSDGVKLCRGANVLPNKVDWSNLAKLPAVQAAGHTEYMLTELDIVVAMDRPWISSGFKIAQVSSSDLPALLVQRVARIRARKPSDSFFIYELMRDKAFTRHCKPTETTIPHISPRDFRSFKFNAGLEADRLAFSARVRQIYATRTKLEAQSILIETLFSSLQHRAFSGQL
ncbi:restriction endonuclease subunit S [Rhizobium rhizogenes]